ncbi:hypothetical protein BH11PLA1_BH11PLA1_00410 [soil metagenome]
MSTPGRPLVIQTEHLDEEPAAWLAERADLRRCGADDAEFPDLLRAADALLVRTYTRVSAEMLAKAPHLRAVARAGVGLDNIDLVACAARGVKVLSTPDANTSAVIEYVLALMLDITRPRVFLSEAIEPERWRELRQDARARRQLREMTLGIIGMGRIGQGLARVALALGMPVVYHDLIEIAPERRFGAAPVALAELGAAADIVSIHIDGRPSNRNAINAGIFKLLKPEVLLINTSRGFVIDNLALADFMIASPSATALLDVHEPEPFDGTYPLLEIANIHLSPHIASATELAQRNMSWVVRDLWDAIRV